MLGLTFKIENKYNNFLYKIFDSVDVLNYRWEIIHDEILYKEDEGIKQGLFASDVLTGQDFLNTIKKKSYYMIFVDLKAFAVDSAYVEINTFQDFLESDCQIILLCVDSEFIDFYCKEKSILDIVYNNCVKYGFRSVEYLSLEEAHKRGVIAF